MVVASTPGRRRRSCGRQRSRRRDPACPGRRASARPPRAASALNGARRLAAHADRCGKSDETRTRRRGYARRRLTDRPETRTGERRDNTNGDEQSPWLESPALVAWRRPHKTGEHQDDRVLEDAGEHDCGATQRVEHSAEHPAERHPQVEAVRSSRRQAGPRQRVVTRERRREKRREMDGDEPWRVALEGDRDERDQRPGTAAP